MDRFLFARRKRHTLKAPQVILIGCYVAELLLQVQLNYVIAGPLSCIGDIHRHFHIALLVFLFGRYLQVAALKGSIAQAVTEGIKRAVYAGFAPAVFAALGRLGAGFERKIEFNLAHGFREGNGQLAARVVIAEKGFSYHAPAFGPGEPGFQYGRHIFVFPING